MPPELTGASAVHGEEHGSITLGEAANREERGEPLPPELEERVRRLSQSLAAEKFQRRFREAQERVKRFQQACQWPSGEKGRRMRRTFDAWQQLPEHEREHWNERLADAASYREIQARLRSLATATPTPSPRPRAPRRRSVRTAARRARAPASRSGDEDPEPPSSTWPHLAVASRRMLEHVRRREAKRALA